MLRLSYFYSKEKYVSTSRADKVLVRKAFEQFTAPDANWTEKLAALTVVGAMKVKVKLGKGFKKTQINILLNKTTFITELIGN